MKQKLKAKRLKGLRPRFTKIISPNVETFERYMEQFLNGEEFSSTPPDCKGGSLLKHKQTTKGPKRG
jgi:hypothetical protein